MSFFWHSHGKADIHLLMRGNQSQAVWPNHPHIVFINNTFHPFFQFLAFITGFLKTSRHNDKPLDPCFPTFFNKLRDSLGICSDHRQVRDLRQAFYSREAWDAKHRFIFWVNRVNYTSESTAN